MLIRLSALTPVNTRGMWVGTFHGLCNRMLRAHHRDANLPQLFQILDTQDQLSLIKRMYRAHNLDDDRYPPKQLQWFIADAKEEGLRPNMVEATDELSRRQVEHYALYDAMCQREGVVDFAELLLRSYELLARQRGPARALPATLLAPARRRVPGHQHAAVQVAAHAGRAAHGGVRRRRRRPVDLRVPRRQGRQHAAVRARLRHAGAAGQADQARAELPVARAHPRRRQRADPPQPGAAGQEPVDERGQGRAGARVFGARPTTTRPRSSSTWSRASATMACAHDEVALLYRSNAQSRVLEHALFGAGIPYRVYGGMRFFERAEVKHALAYLRLIAAPGDDGAFLRVVNFPPRGIGARTLEQPAGRRARRRARRCGRSRRRARSTGKAGSSLGAFVRLIETLRERHQGAAAARGGRARDREVRPARALQGGEGRAGSRREPAGAGDRGRRLRARGGTGHRRADADRPRRRRRAVAGRRARRKARPIR